MTNQPTPQSVSAVVCTKNSIASIRECLDSLRNVKVGEVIVVDANSSDGTREIANELADLVLSDPGTGLGTARNMGIKETSGSFVLNMGSDNIMPPAQLELMIHTMVEHQAVGVGAQTRIQGDDFVARGLNAWRKARFVPGESEVIGTPSLFRGDLLRAHPFSEIRAHSDDAELCERWRKDMDARFWISSAVVLEIGKCTMAEVVTRCNNYGTSDLEVFRAGRLSGWTAKRQLWSITHPARVDLIAPMYRLPFAEALRSAPFLLAFTALRYRGWIRCALANAMRRTPNPPTVPTP